VRAGEIVGLAGLMGAGRSEVASALFGIEHPSRGRIVLRGTPVEVRSPAHCDRARDRLRAGGSQATGTGALRERIAQHVAPDPPAGCPGCAGYRRGRERSVAREYFDRLRVRTPSLDASVAGLSGGNQQKIVLAKWLAAKLAAF
jgi:ABC-type sugar transport system ATPase subunit